MMDKDRAENMILDTDDKPTSSSNYKLDSCLVKVDPPMNFDDYNKEHMRYPENLIDQLMLEVYQKEDGLIISGGYLVALIGYQKCKIRFEINYVMY